MKINPLKILEELSFERIAGTEGEKKAARIIMSYLDKLNLNIDTEEYDINTFEPGKGTLKIDNKVIDVKPFGLNENCNVKAEMVYIENPEVLALNKKSFENKIVLINGYSRKCLESLIKQKVAAVIVIGSPMRQSSSISHRQKTYEEGYVNSATISYDDALQIYKKLNKIAELNIEQNVSKQKARNIIADIKGFQPDGNLTYLVAHYDSVSKTEGATDNAGGSVSLLKTAEYFAGKQPKRDLRIIFFSGEELGLLGSQNYVATHQKEIKERAGLVVNIDISGDSIAQTKAIVTGSKELLGYSQGLSRETGDCINHILDIYSSDQMPFVRYEIPGISFARIKGLGSFFIHTRDDRHKFVSNEGLKLPIKASINLLDRVLNGQVYPVDKKIDPSLREKIEKYIWNLNFEEPTLHWTPRYKS